MSKGFTTKVVWLVLGDEASPPVVFRTRAAAIAHAIEHRASVWRCDLDDGYCMVVSAP